MNSKKAINTPMAEASVAVAKPVNKAPNTPRINAKIRRKGKNKLKKPLAAREFRKSPNAPV
jgi:hypothetical protein